MAKNLKGTYWARNFGPSFQPLREVDWRLFASSSSEEVEGAMTRVLEACKDERYSWELLVKQHGKWIQVDLVAKFHWWALEHHLFDEVSCFIMEWTSCPDGKKYKAFKK